MARSRGRQIPNANFSSKKALVFGGVSLVAGVTILLWAHASVISNLPDTTSGIHLVVGNDIAYPQSQHQSIVDSQADFIWQTGSPSDYSHAYTSFYMYSNLDPAGPEPNSPGPNHYHTLQWFQQNHPDWIMYLCDSKGSPTTPAYEFSQQTDSSVPLDLSNPEVIDYQMGYLESYPITDPTTHKTTASVFSPSSGYKGISFDIVSSYNTYNRCGHYDKNGKWIRLYTGIHDPQYQLDVVNWAATIRAKIKAQANFGITYNLSYGGTSGSGVSTSYVDADIIKYADGILDETGLTRSSNTQRNYELADGEWQGKMAYWQYILGQGKNLILFNYPLSDDPFSPAQEINWSTANYLLLKNDHTYLASAYGLSQPGYHSPIGSPTSPAPANYQQISLYSRTYSSGLVLVNPSSTTPFSITLSQTYHDIYGQVYSGTINVTPHTGLVLLMNTTASPSPPLTDHPAAASSGLPIPTKVQSGQPKPSVTQVSDTSSTVMPSARPTLTTKIPDGPHTDRAVKRTSWLKTLVRSAKSVVTDSLNELYALLRYLVGLKN